MNFVKNIMDSIHGSIKLTELESEIIDHPLFQRLRNIRQLGTTHLIYPGAVHTRFVHSLGTMHIASLYFDSLLSDFKKNDDYYMLKQAVRISALMHDIGHGPFSHTFEKTFEELKVKDIQHNEIKFDFSHIKSESRDQYLNSRLKHEHLSISLIYKIFEEINSNKFFNARNICSLLDSEIEADNDLNEIIDVIIRNNNKKSNQNLRETFLDCIRSIISGEFDADRLDYLQRDAQHCGVKLTGIDLAHIFESVKISQSNNQYHILINRNCVASLEQMLISRKFMYDQVYNHKLGIVFDWILENIFTELKVEDHIKFIHNYEGFIVQSDGYIISKIKDCVQSRGLDSQKSNFFKAFLTRSKPLNIEYEVIGIHEENLDERFKKDHSSLTILEKSLKDITSLDINNPGGLYMVLNRNYDNPQKLESYLEITKEGFYKKKRKLLLAFEDINSREFTEILEKKEKIFLPKLTVAAS